MSAARRIAAYFELAEQDVAAAVALARIQNRVGEAGPVGRDDNMITILSSLRPATMIPYMTWLDLLLHPRCLPAKSAA